MLLVLYIITVTISVLNSSPTAPGSTCLLANQYTWEVYRILFKTQIYDNCEEAFSKLNYNLKYCQANILQTVNMVQKDPEQSPQISSSGSGAPAGAGTNAKCHFEAKFSFDKGVILGGDIAIYQKSKISSKDVYGVAVYLQNEANDEILMNGSHHFSSKTIGWRRIEVNKLWASFGEGIFKVHLVLTFTLNGEDISCNQAQRVFITDCNQPASQDSSGTYSPVIVLITKRESFFFGGFGRKKREALASTDNSKCQLKKKQVSIPGIGIQSKKMISDNKVEIGECVNEFNQPCEPKKAIGFPYITKTDTSSSMIKIIPNMVAVKC